MKILTSALLLIGMLGLGACTSPETYPITGESCGPEDPVRELDAADCGTPGLL